MEETKYIHGDGDAKWVAQLATKVQAPEFF